MAYERYSPIDKNKNRMYKKVLKSRHDFHLNKHFKKYNNILTHVKKEG